MNLQSRIDIGDDILESWVSDDGTHGFSMWVIGGYLPAMFDILTRRPTPARALRDLAGAAAGGG